MVLNGREWLARQLDKKRIGYQRRDNCFTWIEDSPEPKPQRRPPAQDPLEAELDGLLQIVLPSRELWLPRGPLLLDFDQSSGHPAFRDADTLAELYPQLIRRGIETFRSEDVLRFLGKRVTAEGRVPASFIDEVTSDLKHRPEGVRIKHRAGRNTVKLYDKQGSVLRVETTLNEVSDFISGLADDPSARVNGSRCARVWSR